MGSAQRENGVMTTVADLDSERYISLTTYKRDGTPVATPIWFAAGRDPGTFVAYTEADAGKAKRIRATGRVSVRPCDMRGKVRPTAPTFEGTARVLDDAASADAEARLAKKYSWQKRLFELGATLTTKLRRKAEPDTCYLELTLHDPGDMGDTGDTR
jgi:uncharacterized protein